MTAMAIKLEPAPLANPDADLRYLIPECIERSTGGAVREDGYDYLADDAMIIFLTADSPDRAADVLAALAAEPICGNHILETAVIAVDDGDGYKVEHPPGYAGPFNVEETT